MNRIIIVCAILTLLSACAEMAIGLAGAGGCVVCDYDSHSGESFCERNPSFAVCQ